MSGFSIGSRKVGDGAPCLIVAEVAQAHEGSLRVAHDFIDAIADAGADAVKFQCHLGDDTDRWRIEPPWPQDNSRQEYWQRTGFDRDQWWSLQSHAEARGLIFLCSPFSVEAVKLLDPLVQAWKVASGEVTNDRLLEAIARTGKPVLLSSGMATCGEMDAASSWFGRYVFLQCTSEYPTPAEHVGLDWFRYCRDRTSGLSDHSGTIWPSLAAVTLGASVVEVHVKLSAHDQGFDASSSITIEDLARLVEGVRFIEKAKQPVDKDALARELEPMRRLFMGRSERRKPKTPYHPGGVAYGMLDFDYRLLE